MEKRDYLLLEIEKIGLMLKMIINKLSGKMVYSPTTMESQYSEVKIIFLEEIGFDLQKFMEMNEEESLTYIGTFEGFNTENIEILAHVIKEIGVKNGSEINNIFLKKALMLYEYCTKKDRKYSFDRENKIREIRSFI